MSTTTELRDEVLGYQFNAARYGDRIVRWLDQAHKKVARKANIRLGEDTYEFTLTSPDNTEDLPSDFARTILLARQDNTGKLPLTKFDLNYFDSVYTTDATGCPYGYAVSESTLMVTPNPDRDYEYYLRYYKLPETLTLSGIDPVTPSDYDPVLVDYALFRAYASEHDKSYSDYHKGLYDQGLLEMMNDLQQDTDDPPTQVEGMWAGYEDVR